jgi:hypothetical protein
VGRAVCGTTLQKITLTLGATSCTAKYSNIANRDPAVTYPCDNAFSGTTCGSFLGTLLITLDPTFPTGPSTLAQTYLASLGIGGINWVGNLLIGHDIWTGAALQPTLLPSLVYVDGLFGVTAYIEQIINAIPFGFADTLFRDVERITPINYGLPGVTVPVTGLGIGALPGQVALRGVGNLMTLFGTSLPDMSSFSGLRCVGTLWISDNPKLTTLSGLTLFAPPAGGLVYDSTTENLSVLTQDPGLTTLFPISNCFGEPGNVQTSFNKEYINMYVQFCPVGNWNQMCVFQQFGGGPCQG